MQIKIDSIQNLDAELSWMIGIWVGDNFSSKEGTVIRNGKRSSGKFGIINNDEEIIIRFLEGLKNKFNVEKVKLDIHIPRHEKFNKEKVEKEMAEKFGINPQDVSAYYGGPWRKKIGYAVYTNNTALLRAINEKIYQNLNELILRNQIYISSFLQGIADSEGDVNKVGKLIGITNTDKHVIEVIKICFKSLEIPFRIRIDNRNRTIFEIRVLNKFYRYVGFYTKRKQMALKEMLEGNFCRKKDMIYMRAISNHLENGITAKELSKKCKINYHTLRYVLRNLSSNGTLLIEKQKQGKTYCHVYRLSTRLLN